jgi:hypothetical protein
MHINLYILSTAEYKYITGTSIRLLIPLLKLITILQKTIAQLN